MIWGFRCAGKAKPYGRILWNIGPKAIKRNQTHGCD